MESSDGSGLHPKFDFILPWFNAWHVEPRDRQMIVACKNDLMEEFGDASVGEIKVGMVNESIRHAALKCLLEKNEGNQDCIIDQNIEGCCDILAGGKGWWRGLR